MFYHQTLKQHEEIKKKAIEIIEGFYDITIYNPIMQPTLIKDVYYIECIDETGEKEFRFMVLPTGEIILEDNNG